MKKLYRETYNPIKVREERGQRGSTLEPVRGDALSPRCCHPTTYRCANSTSVGLGGNVCPSLRAECHGALNSLNDTHTRDTLKRRVATLRYTDNAYSAEEGFHAVHASSLSSTVLMLGRSFGRRAQHSAASDGILKSR